MHQVYLGLGTNIGQRRHNLQQAMAALAAAVTVTAVSAVYETAPWGVTEQPAFLNLCLSGWTHLEARELLQFVKQCEKQVGRQKTYKWGPRLIDIDILLLDDLVIQTEELTIPHPFLAERPFVLIPLADIAPDVRHPLLKQTMGELATAVAGSGVSRLAKPIRFEVHENI